MEDREKTIYKVTIIGGFVNVLLTLGKLLAGFLGNSGAMIADGVHSASDMLTDIILLLFVKISSKPKDDDHEYGHGRFETLGTCLIGLSLLIVAIGIISSAIESIKTIFSGGEIPSPKLIALLAAGISIIAKEWLYQYTARKGKNLKSEIVIANAWHHRSDAFSSIGTLIGIGGAYFIGNFWTILDPIAAIIVSALIIKVSYDLTIPALQEFLEKSLPKETKDEIIAIALDRTNVSNLHNLKTRRIGAAIAIEFHLRVDGSMSVEEAHGITVDIECNLRQKFGPMTQINIHIEPIK